MAPIPPDQMAGEATCLGIDPESMFVGRIGDGYGGGLGALPGVINQDSVEAAKPTMASTKPGAP